MPHADLLAALLPPVSYAPSGPHLAASLAMEGRELDRVQADAAHAVGGLRPFLYQQWLEDYERVYGLPGPCALGGQLLQERLALLAVALQERGASLWPGCAAMRPWPDMRPRSRNFGSSRLGTVPPGMP